MNVIVVRWLLLFVLVLGLIVAAPVFAQEVTETPPPAPTEAPPVEEEPAPVEQPDFPIPAEWMLPLLVAASTFVNRAVETLKPRFRSIPVSEDIQNSLLTLASVVLGIVVVFTADSQLNLLAALPIPPLVGLILTGAVIGLGADAIHVVYDLFYSWRRPPAIAASVEHSMTSHTIEWTPPLTPNEIDYLKRAAQQASLGEKA